MSQPVLAHERAQKILDEIKGVRSLNGVNDKAIQFLLSLVARRVSIASVAQRQWLTDIERMVFPETEDRA